jgi:hypothetical protein
MWLVVIAAMAVPAVAFAQGRSRDDQRRRNQIRLMEGVLVQAVRLGAEAVGTEMEKYEPAGVTALTGTPRARGFVLDGYGIFFDVEIPELNQSVVWSLMNFRRDQQVAAAFDSMRAAIESLPDSTNRQQALLQLQQASKTVASNGPARSGDPAAATPVSSGPAPAPGRVSAANAAAMPDPDQLYTDAVKSALVDAMLDYSLQMNLNPDEWLTVAARASESPLSPAGLSDAITIILRVKGGDLAVYHADKSKRDEIVQKVKSEARVF